LKWKGTRKGKRNLVYTAEKPENHEKSYGALSKDVDI